MSSLACSSFSAFTVPLIQTEGIPFMYTRICTYLYKFALIYRQHREAPNKKHQEEILLIHPYVHKLSDFSFFLTDKYTATHCLSKIFCS